MINLGVWSIQLKRTRNVLKMINYFFTPPQQLSYGVFDRVKVVGFFDRVKVVGSKVVLILFLWFNKLH